MACFAFLLADKNGRSPGLLGEAVAFAAAGIIFVIIAIIISKAQQWVGPVSDTRKRLVLYGLVVAVAIFVAIVSAFRD